MPIAELRGYWLDVPLSAPLYNSIGGIDRREALFVELVGDDGISGWGETQRSPEAVWAAITALAPILFAAGEPDIQTVWDAASAPGGEVALMAASALDLALWDLRGRREGRPVAELLGGARRDRLRAYASGPFLAGNGDRYRGLIRDAEVYREAGFTAMKPRSGVTPELDAAALTALRVRLGDDVGLAIDINTGYDPRRAAELLRRCEPIGLRWVEEPLPPFELDGYSELSRSSSVPIAAGENLFDFADYDRALLGGAFSIVQPDLFLCGGFTGALRIAALAERHGVPLLPHVFGGAVNLAASLQLAAVLPAHQVDGTDYPWFEYDRNENPLRTLVPEPVVDADGTVAVPQSPGIGIELDRDRLAAFTRRAWVLTRD